MPDLTFSDVYLCLFCDILSMASKCGNNEKKGHARRSQEIIIILLAQPSVVLRYSFNKFYVFCDLFLYRPTATWSLFHFFFHKKILSMATLFMLLSFNGPWVNKNHSNCVHTCYSTYIQNLIDINERRFPSQQVHLSLCFLILWKETVSSCSLKSFNKKVLW